MRVGLVLEQTIGVNDFHILFSLVYREILVMSTSFSHISGEVLTSRLEGLVDRMDISEDEFRILDGILYFLQVTDLDAEVWLRPYIMDHRSIEGYLRRLLEYQVMALEIPFEDLPMYISFISIEVVAIVWWRLQIGR